MFVARTIEILGGFGLVLGIYPQIAAIAVIAFLVPATLVAHEFWRAVGTSAFAPQLLQFLKNTDCDNAESTRAVPRRPRSGSQKEKGRLINL
jgi:hypothetical protein